MKKTKKKKEKKREFNKALPPIDNPLLREEVFESSRGLDSKEMAEKRLEALKKSRKMPTSEDEEKN